MAAEAPAAVPTGPIEEPKTFGSLVRAASVGDEAHLSHNIECAGGRGVRG